MKNFSLVAFSIVVLLVPFTHGWALTITQVSPTELAINALNRKVDLTLSIPAQWNWNATLRLDRKPLTPSYRSSSIMADDGAPFEVTDFNLTFSGENFSELNAFLETLPTVQDQISQKLGYRYRETDRQGNQIEFTASDIDFPDAMVEVIVKFQKPWILGPGVQVSAPPPSNLPKPSTPPAQPVPPKTVPDRKGDTKFEDL